MKLTRNKKIAVQLMSILCAILIITPVCNAGIKADDNKIDIKEKIKNLKSTWGGTEFWALLIGVGVYENHPDEDRPSMLRAVDDFREVLLNSPLWSNDHIHTLKGEQATMRNLIKELFWLIRSDDKNDMTLIYITTHGGPLKNKDGENWDIIPRDEDDGADEILMMTEGFEQWYGKIWDDLLNFFINLLQSMGVCIIIDSCNSGGFDDLKSPGRVVLMSCKEDELSYGSVFTNCLIDGFWGEADLYGNGDGVNSAEEAFDYAISQMSGNQHPVIHDDYTQEFPITFP